MTEYVFLAFLLTGSVSGEFDATDVGAGARASWHPVPLVGVEGEVSYYPGDLGGPAAFSGSRVEGLFGATVGPRLGRVRPFAKLRPGFLRVGGAPRPIACIAIFPPPLRCTLAGGRTLVALDAGGGVEWLSSGRTFVRVDAGDRMVRYPAPAIDSGGAVRSDAFTGHDFRFTLGAGVRF
ncbi:MAG: hypothetical protein FJW14_13680 [Acidimicrobiia bacterium]|nr:hypothetical protein [Acidimicrobiia bacterium]